MQTHKAVATIFMKQKSKHIQKYIDNKIGKHFYSTIVQQHIESEPDSLPIFIKNILCYITDPIYNYDSDICPFCVEVPSYHDCLNNCAWGRKYGPCSEITSIYHDIISTSPVAEHYLNLSEFLREATPFVQAVTQDITAYLTLKSINIQEYVAEVLTESETCCDSDAWMVVSKFVSEERSVTEADLETIPIYGDILTESEAVAEQLYDMTKYLPMHEHSTFFTDNPEKMMVNAFRKAGYVIVPA